MKVLIIENEIYLSQHISNKLSELNYLCECVNSFDEQNTKHYDIVLIANNINNFTKLVEKFKQSIVILLVSYISTDTVSTPLKLGASDYIQKPFMIEELIRKIKHYQDFKRISMLNQTYEGYIKSHLKMKIQDFNYKKIKLPLLLKANKQSSADAFVFNYITKLEFGLLYFDLSKTGVDKILKLNTENNLLFLSNFQTLNAKDKDQILDFIKNKKAILHTSLLLDLNLTIIDLKDTEKEINSDEILTLDEYVKYIINTYQGVFSDIDLAKKLGISRKSLWEKRKRYDIKKR